MTDYEQAIRDELEIHGAVVTRIRAGGKHRRIYFEWDGQEQFYTFAVSPSDHRAMENARSGIRKMLGVKRQVHKNPENKTRTRNRTEPKASPDLACEPAANPFDALAEHPAAGPCIDKPGIYDLTLEQYLSEPCAVPSISSHGLRLLLNECAAKYWWNSPLNPKQPEIETKPMNFGKAAHDWLLMGETFLSTIHVLGPKVKLTTNAGKAERDEAKAEGKVVIKTAEFEIIKEMHATLEAHEFAGAAFRNGQPEKSLVWQDSETGVWLRCRPDWLPAAIRHIPDYKTAVSSQPEAFRKQVWNLGYHMQAALYLDGIEAVTGTAPKSFFFVVQEKEAPYVVTCIALDPISIEWGRIQNRKAIATYAECLRTGKWPGYANEVVQVELPYWAEADLMRQHEAGKFDTSKKDEAA